MNNGFDILAKQVARMQHSGIREAVTNSRIPFHSNKTTLAHRGRKDCRVMADSVQ